MFRSGDLVPGGETSECGTNAEQVLDQACFGAAASPNRQGGTCRVGKASGRVSGWIEEADGRRYKRDSQKKTK